MKPDGPVARKSDYVFRDAPFSELAAFIRREHYAKGCSNTAVFAHGLFREDRLVGAALWLPPTKTCAKTVHEDWKRVLSLSRLAILGSEPQNAASLLIGRSIRAIRRTKRWAALVTYADESQGHTGTIYRASNWVDRGVTKPEPRWVDANGRQVSRKAGRRTRTKAQMEALGYRMVGKFRKRKFVMALETKC